MDTEPADVTPADAVDIDPPGQPGNDRSVSKSLDRGLVLLDLVAASVDGLSISDAAQAMGMHRTIVTRLLKTLVGRKYVVRDENGRYYLGGRVLELSRFVRPRVRSAALPVIQELAQKLAATTHLTMADGEEAVAILVTEPTNAPYHVSYSVGNRRALWRGASGIAILSTRAPGAAEPPEVATARERGWALSRGQIEEGMTGVAAPLPSPQFSNYSVGAVLLGTPPDPSVVAAEVLIAARDIVVRLTSG